MCRVPVPVSPCGVKNPAYPSLGYIHDRDSRDIPVPALKIRTALFVADVVYIESGTVWIDIQVSGPAESPAYIGEIQAF